MLRLPHDSRNWGKQRVCYHSLNDWNTLDNETRNTRNIAIFIALNAVFINLKFVLNMFFNLSRTFLKTTTCE